MTISHKRSLVLAFAVVLLGTFSVRAAQIDGTQNSLTSKHGPWMIQVTVLRSTNDPDVANRLATRLVKELRAKGIPAYSVSRHINGNGKPGREANVIVLAGNYESRDSQFAKRTLAWIRRLTDTPMTKELFEASRRKRPFENAFLCLNPLADAIDAE